MSTNEALRRAIRTRLASGSLSSVGGKVSSGRGTGKPCSICAMPILEGDIEQEVVGPTPVFIHWHCYSIWRQESEALARQHSVKTPTPLHIDREDGDIHPPTADYVVSFGGTKDRVGTVLLVRREGGDDVNALISGLGIAPAMIVTAVEVLTE